MRKTYTACVFVVILASACKKEIKEILPVQSPVAVDAPVCYGNTWAGNLAFNGGFNRSILVYNNTIYSFYKNSPVSPYENTVTFYNGSTWQTIPCTIPFSTAYTQFSFVIGNKGYIGYGPIDWMKVYEYDFAANTWTFKGYFPGGWRFYPASFTIDGKGYVVGGASQEGVESDIWEYDPATNDWEYKGYHPGFGRSKASGFSIGNKGYIVNGETPVYGMGITLYTNSLLEYNPASNSWTNKAAFPGSPRSFGAAFVISNYGYAGCGKNDEVRFIDFYKYDQEGNFWTRITDSPDAGNVYAGFAINSRGYTIKSVNNVYKMQKYTPRICTSYPSGSSIN